MELIKLLHAKPKRESIQPALKEVRKFRVEQVTASSRHSRLNSVQCCVKVSASYSPLFRATADNWFLQSREKHLRCRSFRRRVVCRSQCKRMIYRLEHRL